MTIVCTWDVAIPNYLLKLVYRTCTLYQMFLEEKSFGTQCFGPWQQNCLFALKKTTNASLLESIGLKPTAAVCPLNATGIQNLVFSA